MKHANKTRSGNKRPSTISKVVTNAVRLSKKLQQQQSSIWEQLMRNTRVCALTINAGVLGRVVGSASANPLLIAGSAGRVCVGAVTKVALQEIHAGVDLYHTLGREK